MKQLFPPEPRICIVSKTEIVRDDSHNNGPLRITTKETKCRALFHRFATIERPIEASPLKGGPPAGQCSKPVAIVEYEDGTVHMVDPESVRFLDTKELMEQYAWGAEQ